MISTTLDTWKGMICGHAQANVLRFGVNDHAEPNWGKPLSAIPALLTQFEIEVERLRLGKSEYAASAELKRWCAMLRYVVAAHSCALRSYKNLPCLIASCRTVERFR